MKRDTVIKLSFAISLLLTITAATLKLLHKPNSDPFLLSAVISTIIYIVLAIYEVRSSPRISTIEKNMWTIAFIFMSGLAGLIYFIVGRDRIVSKNMR